MYPITPLVYRTDEMEKRLRFRALDTAAHYTSLNDYNAHTRGYIQALRDMKVDKKYIGIYMDVMNRVREAYE